VEQKLERYSISIVEVEEIKDIICNSKVAGIKIKNISLNYIARAKGHSLILI
jgi:hypothetical protein